MIQKGYQTDAKIDPEGIPKCIQNLPNGPKGSQRGAKKSKQAGQEECKKGSKTKKGKGGSGERNARGQSKDSFRLIRLTLLLSWVLNTAGAPRPGRAVFNRLRAFHQAKVFLNYIAGSRGSGIDLLLSHSEFVGEPSYCFHSMLS